VREEGRRKGEEKGEEAKERATKVQRVGRQEELYLIKKSSGSNLKANPAFLTDTDSKIPLLRAISG
jgi:hypothetical protein